MPELEVVAMLVVAAGFAGWIDAVVGGGGLIQLPALVLGLPRDVPTPYVLGTNKVSSFSGTLVASWLYVKKLRVELGVLLPLILGAFAGSATGASVSRYLPREILTPIVLVAVVLVGAYVIWKPSLGIDHRPTARGVGAAVRAGIVGLIVGLYDGLLGPGTGSFFLILIVILLGYGFLQASVHAKLANLTTNVAAIIIYGIHGEILLLLALCMGVANIAGGIIGANMAISGGNAFVRRVLIIVLALITITLGIETVRTFT